MKLGRVEFVKRLTQKYNEKLNRVEVEDLERWMDDENIYDKDLQPFYDAIAREWTWRTFPSLKKISQIWYDNFSSGMATKSEAQVLSKLDNQANFDKSLSIVNALTKMRSIREKCTTGGASSLNMYEMQFLHTYEPLLIEYDSALKKYEGDEARAQSHAATVYAALGNGDRYNSLLEYKKPKHYERSNKTVGLSDVVGVK